MLPRAVQEAALIRCARSPAHAEQSMALVQQRCFAARNSPDSVATLLNDEHCNTTNVPMLALVFAPHDMIVGPTQKKRKSERSSASMSSSSANGDMAETVTFSAPSTCPPII